MPPTLIPYDFPRRSEKEMRTRAESLFAEMNRRRSCRYFSDEPVSRELIEKVIAIAHTAPSGANRKPWRFVAVDDPALKHEIRIASEAEERRSYDHRMPREWLDALESIGTDAHKPFLDIAPWLVVLFRLDWEEINGERVTNYYPSESAGIMAGIFVMACHQVGLATLAHTPSPMRFLREILGRPVNEKPFLLLPVGYPAGDCMVPVLPRKPLSAALQWNFADGSKPNHVS